MRDNSKMDTLKASENIELNFYSIQEILEKVCPMVNVSKRRPKDCLLAE